MLPRNVAVPKLKMPPSVASIQYPLRLGGNTKVKPGPGELVPVTLAAATPTGPGGCGGACTTMCCASIHCDVVAATPPNSAVVDASSNSPPVTQTMVPPEVGPLPTDTDEIVGAAIVVRVSTVPQLVVLPGGLVAEYSAAIHTSLGSAGSTAAPE